MAMFDTYVDVYTCPRCGTPSEFRLRDTTSEKAMRVFFPHDVVMEHVGEPCVRISDVAECRPCGSSLNLNVLIIDGVVGHFCEDPLVGQEPDDPSFVQSFMRRAVQANYQRKQDLEHVLDVVRLAVRLWTGDPTLEIGEDWHLNEPGLPMLHKGMSCDQFLRSMRTYLDASHRSGDGR